MVLPPRERQALAMRQKLGGNENPDVAASLIDLVLIRSLQHDPGSAELLLRQALEIRKKELSAGHRAMVSAETRLGEVLIDEGKAAEAATLLRQAAKEIHEVPFSLSAWQIAEPEIALGAALAAVGEMTEAERLLKNSDSRLKDYPEAALHRQILTRAQGASRKSLYSRLSGK